MSVNDFINNWTNLLSPGKGQTTDVISSITESALNEYLAKHHSLDKDKYHREITRMFNDGTADRSFKLTLDVTSPIRINLPPFSLFDNVRNPDAVDSMFDTKNGWFTPDHPGGSGISARDKNAETPNLRLVCDGLSFKLEWPKLEGDGIWSFGPVVLTIVAEAYVELVTTGGQNRLRMVLSSIKINTKELRRINPPDDTDEKWKDLMVIALNIVATQYAPTLVASIELPNPIVQGKPVSATLLDVSNKMLTFGLTINRTKLRKDNIKYVEKKFQIYIDALEDDISKAGGLDAVFFNNTNTNNSATVFVRKSEEEIQSILSRSTAILDEYKNDLRELWESTNFSQSSVTPKGAVVDGVAIGIDEYLMNSLVSDAIPKPVEKSTDWAQILDVVKGRIDWWVRIFDASISINGTSVTGSTSIDIGGEIEACIRNFWNCSWHWECGNLLSLSVSGRPGIKLELTQGNGLAFRAQLVGSVHLDSNLPYPFNEIIKKLSDLVVQAIIAIINLALAKMTFTISLPTIIIPDQNTAISLSGYRAFPFQRQADPALSIGRQKFIGSSVDLIAIKKP